MPTNRSNPNQNAGDGTGQGLDMAASTTHLALVPTWVPLAGDTAGSASGSDGLNISSGGDGYATGVVASTPTATFVPENGALALSGTTATANQSNHALADQQATEIAGAGGNGGVSYGLSTHGGHGGDGTFAGALVSADVGVFAPVNTAVGAGPGAHADANQSNSAAFLQDATQGAGLGGSGGATYAAHGSGGSQPLVINGDVHGGHGGDGTFVGTLTDINVAIFAPINIAVAGAGGTAHATQDNNALISQGATQIAGIGGGGGGFYVPSDTIVTGTHSDGASGDGHATGSLVAVNVAYVEPMNIAVPAGGAAEADQVNHLLYDQHALQVAGVGGDPGSFHFLDDQQAALVHDSLHTG